MGMSRYVKAVARAQLATGFGIIVFWILFFTVGLAPANPPVCYFAFEHAFPLPENRRRNRAGWTSSTASVS